MNTEPKQNEMPQKQTSQTAQDLVMNHINHPDTSITSEDIQNIDTNLADKSEQLTAKQKEEADGLADEIQKDDTGMSYKAGL